MVDGRFSRQDAGTGETTCRVFQSQFDGVARIVEDRQYERISLVVHPLLDHSIDQLEGCLQITVEIVFSLGLRSDARILFATIDESEERIMRYVFRRLSFGFGCYKGFCHVAPPSLSHQHGNVRCVRQAKGFAFHLR